ncbi:hypothetical protein B2G71_08190 [Novosphingobium sp. PC22D]|uniref:hypothetical protein n=1 Tax=Novosphingobium sp. PC22D TaxID=1962403 RepID=UPI000BF0336E|nr:hypothetical protein [Novosphingobium sp. PC22D]PEQ13398.1 hypothetical protein B2G71_08190 [Novosphingobium sp. PC22D]
MMEPSVRTNTAEQVEAALRDELARGNAMVETVVPIVRHLITNDDNSVFSDEILARVRGMTSDLAEQLLDAFVAADGADRAADHSPGRVAALAQALIDNPGLLAHVHALAIEWQLTERLQARLSLDPVVPPLLQALVASPDGVTQELAMRALAAQARFGQAQRRMKLALAELPGEQLHAALIALRTQAARDMPAAERAAIAERNIRAAYDEAANRLGLMARLVHGMGHTASGALSVTHAGVAIFTTALALFTGQNRDTVVLSLHETQVARLALGLRAAGLRPASVEEQFLALHPEIALPEGFERLGPDRAAAILASDVPEDSEA